MLEESGVDQEQRAGGFAGAKHLRLGLEQAAPGLEPLQQFGERTRRGVAAPGRMAAELGLSLSQSVEGFLQFRRPFLHQLGSFASRRGLDATSTTELIEGAERAMDRLLMSAMAGHGVRRAGLSPLGSVHSGAVAQCFAPYKLLTRRCRILRIYPPGDRRQANSDLARPAEESLDTPAQPAYPRHMEHPPTETLSSHSKILHDAITFDDVLLIPARSDFIPNDAQTHTKLTRGIELNIPLLSAPMDTVTESALAIALAQEGGIGIIHKNLSVENQAREVEKVKRSENGVIVDPITLPPVATIGEARRIMHEYNVSGIPIVEWSGVRVQGSGVRTKQNGDSKLVGILTRRDLKYQEDDNRRVGDAGDGFRG